MKKIIGFLIIFILFVVGILLYAKYIGTMGFITKEYTLYHDNLPISFDGLKVVHFSDIHFNRAISQKKINDIVDEINLINADIVVFTGDLIDKDVELNDYDYEFLTNALNSIYAKYGKYAILGNHDKYNYDNVMKVFNNSDFMYLDNKYETIAGKNGENIAIIGVSDTLLDISKLDVDYRISLVHTPDLSDQIIDKYSAKLILAGHSHNGQIRLPYIGALYTPEGAKKYYDEYYKVNNTDIYISSGIGVSGVNMRLFNRPSINFYRINKK